MRKSELALYNLALYATNAEISCTPHQFAVYLADFLDTQDQKGRLIGFNKCCNTLLVVPNHCFLGTVKNYSVKI